MNHNRVRIVTDSSCDLPQHVADDLGIEIVPLSIRFGDREYVDRAELTPAEFWAMCKKSATLPETAAPSPGQFAAVYRQLISEGATSIVVVNISAALSATMQSAEIASRAVADQIKVTVIDSRTVTLGLGVIAVDCARLAAEGASHGAIVERATDLASRTKVWGALDTLENLRKGGRIGAARALLASALAIKPIIEVRDGKVEPGGKQRTRTKALAFIVDVVANAGPIENLMVLHARCDDVAEFVAMVREHYKGDIVISDIGPVVGSHAGRGTMGVAYALAR